jgi:heme/copper-type cytochrome/quinol oxidase subunit 2
VSLDAPTRLPGSGRQRHGGWRNGSGPILVTALLLVVAVAFGAYQAGAGRAERSAAVATPATTAPAGEVSAATTAPPRTTPPARPRVVGTLITKNLGTEASPDRVYVAAGQSGTHPRFVARPGERIQIKVNNKDTVIHSFTFDQARVNLDAWAGKISTEAFLAPKKPGTYSFYCRYRKVGMSGSLVVRG